VKILSSVILSLMLLVLWSCSDDGKDPLSSGDETDCTQDIDCNSVCGGSSVVDECGVCGGSGVDETTGCCADGLDPNDETQDCAGVCGGDAADDVCGTCGGNITNAPECECDDEDVVRDCTGDCGGSAVDDACGICSGSGVDATTGCCADGLGPNDEVQDCTGACGGSAVLTDCGCGEAASDATTGCCANELGPNDEVQDCAGACGGSAVNDNCNVCGGDNSSCSSLIDYLTEIQPIFNSRCVNCHINGNSGGLNLSSWSSLMVGDSNNGPVVTVGDSTNSLLWIKVNSGSMPLNGSDLTDAQIYLIAQWIFEGALEEPPNN